MLTAEIKINGKIIANIKAVRGIVISDEPGDFIGDRATVCKYSCVGENPLLEFRKEDRFTVIHNRQYGWQGLLNKITEKVIPVVIETMTLEEGNVKDNMGV